MTADREQKTRADLRGRGADFWDAKARTFPRYTGDDDCHAARMLRLLREQGVDFAGKSVLDVGCGSGLYTIRLAQEAAQVTALDFSPEMLRLLREDADARGLTNITYVRSGWLEFSSPRTFDIVFASMTPAVEDDASREKLMEHAADRVVYLGWRERSVSNIMAGLLRHYGLKPKRHDAAQRMRAWLDGKGIAYRALPVSGRWDVPWKLDDLLHSCACSLAADGVEADRDFLIRHLEPFREENGLYRELSDYVIELILWRRSRA